MLLADYLATHIVNGVFTTPGSYTSLETLVGIVAYSVQIYCDFSAYADIAIGVVAAARLRAARQLRRPVHRRLGAGLLAPLAHDALAVAARLPLHPAGRQPQGADTHLRQHDAHDGARRPLARRRLDVRVLGRAARRCTRPGAPPHRRAQGALRAPAAPARAVGAEADTGELSFAATAPAADSTDFGFAAPAPAGATVDGAPISRPRPAKRRPARRRPARAPRSSSTCGPGAAASGRASARSLSSRSPGSSFALQASARRSASSGSCSATGAGSAPP